MPERARLPTLITTVALGLSVLVAGCGAPSATDRPTPPPTREATPAITPTTTPADAAGPLVLMTHDSFAVSDEVMAEFQTEHGVTVQVLKAGDAGSMVNQAILTREAPLADVLFGVDNTFLSRALEAEIFIPYASPQLERLPEELRLDAQARVTPIDYGDVCLNVDLEAFDADLPPPLRLENLTDPAYRGMLVVENPATSSPGLAFLLATVARFGEEGRFTWLDYWADLRENDVEVASGWEEAYYGSFSGGAGEGERPIVVSYATSPAAEIVFAETPIDQPTTSALTDDCFRQIEFAGVLAGTQRQQLAEAFIDFMLSRRFQEDIPLNMFVYPASPEAELPEVFVEHAVAAPEPIVLDPQSIGTERERWIEEWTDVVLR